MTSPGGDCRRRLSGHRPRSPAEVLAELAADPAAALPPDMYGHGGAVDLLERRTCDLLGKPAASFFIKGIIAQMCVLRVAAERARTSNVVLHPMSHIDFDEQDAAFRLHPLRPIRVGRYAPFTVAELEALTEPVAALVVELPLRRSGYRQPLLADLHAISAWARERGIHLHFDGARLWESAAGYDIPLPELAALADSVYVSFYKGLGGLGGAVVAGEPDFISALAVWRARHGANLYRAYPLAISAVAGLDAHLPRMSHYVARARALAQLLGPEPRLAITPTIPDVNAFHLLIPGAPGELTERNRTFAERDGVWLFNGFLESPVDGHSIAEVVVGDCSDDWQPAEAAAWIRGFLDLA